MNEAIWGLIGVVIGSGMTIAKDAFSVWRQERKSGAFSAMRLVTLLQEYVSQCIDVVGDDGTSHGRPAGRKDDGEEYHVAQVRLPEPPIYPDDIVWRSLPRNLMFGVLALPNKARATNRYVQGVGEFVANYPDYEEFFEARQEGYARLALEALLLAESLAAKFSFSTEKHSGVMDSDWNPKTHLLEKIAIFDELRDRGKMRETEASDCMI